MGKKYRILIGDNTPVYQQACTTALVSLGFEVQTTAKNGVSVLDEIRLFAPDIVIVEEQLPYIDIYQIIAYLKSAHMKLPRFILIRSDYEPSYAKELIGKEVAFYLDKPFDLQVLYHAIVKWAVHSVDEQGDLLSENVYSEVADALRNMNCPMDGNGFSVLCYALTTVILEPSALELVTKNLYRKVAKNYSMSDRAVEVALRRRIEMIWSTGDSRVLSQYFGDISTVIISRKRPSNLNFLKAVSAKLRQELLEKQSASLG